MCVKFSYSEIFTMKSKTLDNKSSIKYAQDAY